VTASPDHKLYRQYSHQLMDFLRTYTEQIEQVSVDECYMDFTQIADRYPSPVAGAVEIKDEVRKRFGYTVNVGISSNKLLAKMASDFEKPDRVHTLFPEEIQAKMWPLPVGDLFMVGHASAATLQKLGIDTIGELAQTDPKLLELHLKSHGRKLWESANGIGSDVVESEPTEAKGIGNSTTLPKDVVTKAEASLVLKNLAESVSRRLKKAGQKAGMISVEIRYHNFVNVSHQMQLAVHTNEAEVIWQKSEELFDHLWNKEPIRLLGIRSSKLVEENEPTQMNLFDIPIKTEEELRREKKRKQLDQALVGIRKKYGNTIVKKGNEV
jgi:DNA polymerase-4